jgi:C2 domain-containing protein 3
MVKYIKFTFFIIIYFSKESRTTRTIARSFVPEFNHSIDFPVPLIWNDNRSQTVSVAEILEHGELKIDIYHQMSSTDDSKQHNDKRSLDIHLCYCTIPLKELIARHTGRLQSKRFP